MLEIYINLEKDLLTKLVVRSKKMNVMGISGTPRKKGNSEILLRSALKPFENNGWNVKMFLLSELKINPCTGCESCRETGTCIIDDDMFYYSRLWSVEIRKIEIIRLYFLE